jgi:aldehyde dehydrogenase (NAD+)
MKYSALITYIEYSSDADIYTVFQNMKTIVFIFTENKIFAKKLFKTILWRRCINTIIHFSNKRLPGGVGHSGIGAYHGALSFDVFSHKKVNSKKQIG